MCSICDWECMAEEIDEMLGSGDFEWARDTLEGISGWIGLNDHVTESQADAIHNIANARRDR